MFKYKITNSIPYLAASIAISETDNPVVFNLLFKASPTNDVIGPGTIFSKKENIYVANSALIGLG